MREHAGRNLTYQEATKRVLRMTNMSRSFDILKRIRSVSQDLERANQENYLQAPALLGQIQENLPASNDLSVWEWPGMSGSNFAEQDLGS